MMRILGRVRDYLEMGVPYIWLIDCESRIAYTASPQEGLRELKTGILRAENPTFEVPLAEIFSE